MRTFLALLMVTTLTSAQDAEDEARRAAESSFRPALGAFANLLKAAPSYRVQVDEGWKVEEGGADDQGGSRAELAVQRPGQFALRVGPADSPDPTLEVACPAEDAEVVALLQQADRPLIQRSRRYDPIEGLKRNPVIALALAPSFLDVVVRPDFVDYVADGLSDVADLGVEEVGGVPARHFRGQWADGRTVELWFAETDVPLLLRVRSTRYTPGSKLDQPPLRIVSTAAYDWTIGEPIADDAFQIEPPAGTVEVDDLYAAATGAGESLKVGEPAPELDLPLLDGGRLILAHHHGKDVVVLNFWATWYPTGVDSLPTVAEFAREYEPKGVAFYHVNMGEAVELVEAFLKTLKDPIRVALDPDARAMETYEVRALPFSVIVDRDGRIAAVNAGDLLHFKERFRGQLDELLGGVPAP